MKKLTALLLALTLLLLASACGGGPGTDSPDANKQIGRASCRERV